MPMLPRLALAYAWLWLPFGCGGAEPPVAVQLDRAPLAEVVSSIEEITGRTVVVGPRVRVHEPCVQVRVVAASLSRERALRLIEAELQRLGIRILQTSDAVALYAGAADLSCAAAEPDVRVSTTGGEGGSPDGIRRVGPQHYEVPRDLVLQMISQREPEPGLVISPYMRNGGLAGIRFDAVPAGGRFAQLGIQTGDIVQRVGGRDLLQAGQFLTELGSVRRFSITLLRNGRPLTLEYTLVDRPPSAPY